MIELVGAQIADLRELQRLCAELESETVIIGALAYQIHFPDEDRHTRDIDCAVALDLEDFEVLRQRLLMRSWNQAAHLEHRWLSPGGLRPGAKAANTGRWARPSRSAERPRQPFD